MKVLAIETTGQRYSCALWDGQRCVAEQDVHQTDASYDGVDGLVGSTLRAAGWGADELQLILANRGPGRVTTIRSGLSYSQALGYAVGSQFHTVDTYQLTAAAARDSFDLPGEKEILVVGAHRTASGGHGGLIFTSDNPVGTLIPEPELLGASASRVVVRAIGSRVRLSDQLEKLAAEVSSDARHLLAAWQAGAGKEWSHDSQLFWESG